MSQVSILKQKIITSHSVADELLKWKELKEQGVISEQEFEDMKKKIMFLKIAINRFTIACFLGFFLVNFNPTERR
ncbi:SHOCT domain-containing protein [Candidatus Nitrosacidococcus tergens]|uniref:SHOCT domain-containing protein n=1 Tax=Candidatus Nitrosacidococcus tergens TaxID=553981 RepID=A0A7G1QA93_9GAMM|nr:SHOCT domain-containing protein [Candidatus Nitrosacidococcus tergens]CAB1275897.1 protein of unknown function [Candidatus Nitrosacidococcus tergens]